MVLALLVSVVGIPSSVAFAATNLVPNGTFEGSGTGSLSGWGGTNGALSLTTGNGGGHAALLTASSGAASTSTYTNPKPVTNAVAGTTYQLAGDIQSGLAGQTVCLVLKEQVAGTNTSVASAQNCVTATSSWQSFATVNYTVKTSGDSLTVNLAEKSAVPGANFAFDNIVLTTSATDTQAPSVPQDVGAVANGPTSVTVSWSASSDASGIANYEVYRGGVLKQTVSGSTLSYTDTSVSAGTAYSYTVDAIDASPAHNTSAQSSPAAMVTTPPNTGGPAEPIITIIMENKPYSEIVGNSNAPYIQSMIAGGTLFTNYQAIPGSLPDYLYQTSGLSGSTSGSENIFHQLQVKGVSWGEYEESMPSTCYTGGDTGSYKKGHNPAIYYNNIKTNPSACANVVPFTAFSTSNLRAFSYVVPNLANDMHDGSGHTVQIKAGDAWLSSHVPAMLNAGAEVILTWDEGNSSDEHVAAIAIGGTAAKGATDSHSYTQPSLLAGLEDAWGLPRINAAQTASPLPIH